MSDVSLPHEWAITSITDICEVKGGKRLPKGEKFSSEVTDHPYLRVTDFKSHTIDKSNLQYISNDVHKKISRYVISSKDLYISIAGTIGLIGTIPEHLSGSNLTENAAKLTNISVSKTYLAYVLQSSDAKNLFIKSTVSSGQPKLALFRIKEVNFPLPPLAEQKEIATRLDELVAQVDTLKTRLDAISTILKSFRQSVLAAAVSGKLTEDWREQVNLRDWKKTSFDQLIVKSNNGLSKRRGDSGDKITVLRLADFKNATRVYGGERQIRLTTKEQDKYLLSDGELLVIRVNGSIDLSGLFILYRETDKEEAFCDHFIRFTVDQSLLIPKFLTFITNEGKGREFLRNSLSTSAGQNTINQKSIKALPLIIPPLEEQTEIVTRVENLFAFADNIEKRVNEAQNHVNNLTQSILAKAFRGDLTADWREQNPDLISGENSAEALLQRIKAVREKLKPKRKPRTKK